MNRHASMITSLTPTECRASLANSFPEMHSVDILVHNVGVVSQWTAPHQFQLLSVVNGNIQETASWSITGTIESLAYGSRLIITYKPTSASLINIILISFWCFSLSVLALEIGVSSRAILFAVASSVCYAVISQVITMGGSDSGITDYLLSVFDARLEDRHHVLVCCEYKRSYIKKYFMPCLACVSQRLTHGTDDLHLDDTSKSRVMPELQMNSEVLWYRNGKCALCQPMTQRTRFEAFIEIEMDSESTHATILEMGIHRRAGRATGVLVCVIGGAISWIQAVHVNGLVLLYLVPFVCGTVVADLWTHWNASGNILRCQQFTRSACTKRG